MKAFTTVLNLALAVGAFARVPRLSSRWGCCSFTASVNGGPLYENPTDSHQLAFGGSEPGPAVTFCISPAGQITDNAGICGITQNTDNDMETSQLQCEAGMTSEFTISCTGELEYNGSPNFFACLASQAIGYNIYATPPSLSQCASGQPKEITLQVGCPGNLVGEWQFPHLIIPISKSSPNNAPGTSFEGTVTPDVSSIFNFDIPEGYSGQQCTLVFDFPMQSQLQTSSFTFSGSGAIDFTRLSSPATQSTSYSNAPSIAIDLGTVRVAPGNSYSISSFSCPAGQAIAFELSSEGGTSLTYFQDFNPCPIGLYITAG